MVDWRRKRYTRPDKTLTAFPNSLRRPIFLERLYLAGGIAESLDRIDPKSKRDLIVASLFPYLDRVG